MHSTLRRRLRPCSRPTRRPVVAFGPEMPQWGSWQWVGEETIRVLSDRFTPVRFGWNEVPQCDVLVIVKHVPPPGFVERLPDRTAVVYCPVDFFESEEQIAACAPLLRRSSRIVVHCERLRSYFEAHAPVEYMDHPVKFITKRPVPYRRAGYVLWAGVWPNLEPLAAWVNDHALPCRLWALTNLEEGKTGAPAEFGFRADRDVAIEQWSPKRQLELMRGAKAAIDIKGSDFRQRHKPPAKGLDFVASGLPLAMNPDSSTAEHLARMGFVLADPLDSERWFSREYWRETQRFGSVLRELLSPRRIGRRFERLFEQVLDERRGASGVAITSGADRPMMQRSEHVSAMRQEAVADEAVSDEQAKYRSACRLAEGGNRVDARRLYQELQAHGSGGHLKALVQNDLAVLAAADGDLETARAGFEAALEMDATCEPARRNLAVVVPTPSGDTSSGDEPVSGGRLPERAAAMTEGLLGQRGDLRSDLRRGPETRAELGVAETGSGEAAPSVPSMACSSASDGPIRVAILSFLFNWPSTGGGIVHTIELAQFLSRAGYQVQHIYARYEPWGIGKVEHRPPFPSQQLAFDESQWTLPEIQRRYREAVEAVDPDCVIITDSWNFKPRLAKAVRGFPYILRFQALECLCPLNNVRLLPAAGGGLRQCKRSQLADPQACRRCLAELAGRSGGLHRVERALSGVGTNEYERVLRAAYRDAEAVFVVNPPAAEMVAPYARRVVVSPAGMDPARFPWPWPEEPTELHTSGRLMIFFAGLVREPIKGFDVLHAACRRLWQRRRDFELVATGDPPGRVDDFTRFVGWQSQEDLPRHLRAADVCAVPAVAQEALGRTAVEAMGAGRPVVASRLGGLPWTIEEGVTGLLCEAGDPEDLSRKIEILLTDTELRRRMGDAGRKRFDERFRWDVVIDRDYRPVLKRREKRGSRVPAST